MRKAIVLKDVCIAVSHGYVPENASVKAVFVGLMVTNGVARGTLLNPLAFGVFILVVTKTN